MNDCRNSKARVRNGCACWRLRPTRAGSAMLPHTVNASPRTNVTVTDCIIALIGVVLVVVLVLLRRGTR